MSRLERGTTYVSLMWVIVLFVVIFAAMATAWIMGSDNKVQKERVAQLTTELQTSKAKEEVSYTSWTELSNLVGYKDPDNTLAPSVPSQIQERLAALKQNYPTVLGADVENLETIVNRLQTELDSANQQLLSSQQQRDSEVAARQAAETNLRDIERQKDEQFAKVESDLQTERDRAETAESGYKTQLETLEKQLADADANHRAAVEEAEKTQVQLTAEMRILNGRILEQGRKLEVMKYPDQPDGEIVEVSSATQICFIDRGRRDLMRPGSRFKVFRYGKAGEMMTKGWIEVRDVKEDRAECGILQDLDEFNPIAPGDRIAAPFYDPKLVREFCLIGQFPSGYSKAMVSDRLRSLGARVVDQVSAATDFLVLGDKEMREDPEDTSGDPAESDDYRLAQKFSVQILPVREILDYVRYD